MNSIDACKLIENNRHARSASEFARQRRFGKRIAIGPILMKTGRQIHYLDHASMGRPTEWTLKRLRAALADVAAYRSGGTDETLRQFDAVESARQRIARFIHADPASILLVGNTTQALGMIATALPLARGDNILIADIEFMGATIVWRGVSRRLGVELVPVKTSGGTLAAENFAACVNSHTRAIIVSSVQEVSGFRADLNAIADVAAKSGAFVIADGIQEVGARPVDLRKLGVDAYCAGGHKWLRSPFGLGFASLSPRLLDALDPSFQGYLALAEPEVGWDRYMELPDRTPFDPLPARRDAALMETGGYPNWLGAVALDAAIEYFQKRGPARVWARIQTLRQRFVRGLSELGVQFLGGPGLREEATAGIVTFCLPGGAAQEKRLLDELTRARIFVALRYVSGVGGIRVAMHESNNDSDIDALLDVTRRFIKRRAAARG
ncbi:MAG: aminotransferase class V-fold PLP-dependent enzyme [Candidatus Acidiferrales bacterium]